MKVDFERQGFASYPYRLNYPKAGTQDESDWLRGWYRAEKLTRLNVLYRDEF